MAFLDGLASLGCMAWSWLAFIVWRLCITLLRCIAWVFFGFLSHLSVYTRYHLITIPSRSILQRIPRTLHHTIPSLPFSRSSLAPLRLLHGQLHPGCKEHPHSFIHELQTHHLTPHSNSAPHLPQAPSTLALSANTLSNRSSLSLTKLSSSFPEKQIPQSAFPLAQSHSQPLLLLRSILPYLE